MNTATIHTAPIRSNLTHRLTTLNGAGTPDRPGSPSRDDGWSPSTRHTGRGRGGQHHQDNAARHVHDVCPTASDVRYHLNSLLAAGMCVDDIAKSAATTPRTLRAIRSNAIQPAKSTAEAILGITFQPSGGRTRTPAIGASRRLRGLNAMGYSDMDLSTRLGISDTVVTAIPTAGQIDTELWRDIAALYDQLSMTPGPDADLRDRARAAGYVPPLGWDDDEIDHPRAVDHSMTKPGPATVDESAVIRRLRGDKVALRSCDIREIVRMIHDDKQQFGAHRLAEVLDIKVASAEKHLVRHRRNLRNPAQRNPLPVALSGAASFTTDESVIAEISSADTKSSAPRGRAAQPQRIMHLLDIHPHRRSVLMSDTFTAALDHGTPADAIYALAAGSVTLDLDTRPEPQRWSWFADLLDSPWGLTGQLPRTCETLTATSYLRTVAAACRLSAESPVRLIDWYGLHSSAADHLPLTPHTPAELSLTTATELALDCVESGPLPYPDGTMTVATAFETILTIAPDSRTARAHIRRALAAWKTPTHFAADHHTGPARGDPQS